jgi:hypothetical protein
MIVVLDTNVFWGDVYAQRSHLRTVLERAAGGVFTVMVPRVCVEELVRQFSLRLQTLGKDAKGVSGTLQAFGIQPPALPETQKAIEEYRGRLEARLSGEGCEIVEYPEDAYLAAHWTAQRRKPIKDAGRDEGKGAPDAIVWLTVLALAREDQVVLVTANSSDFADPGDPSTLHPTLLSDLDERGVDRDRVELLPRLFEFVARHVASAQDAKARADALLEDPATLETLRAEISDALQWYSVPDRQVEEWALGIDIEAAHLADVEVSEIDLVAVEQSGDNLDLSLRVSCQARVDLMIWKYDAFGLADEHPIRVYDYDWNESMAAAEMERDLVLEIQCQYHTAEERFEIDIVDVELT